MSSPDSSFSSHWEPPLPEELQRMLPQYEITGILGRGGMGAVYKGRQAKLDRDVAIKVLPETFSKGDDELNFAARFIQEARAMAKLDHPAIISVYDFGETPGGQLYFVMEFIDGMDIQQYLRHHHGKLPQESAVSIVAHVLDALDYAHSQGIVHRDIKPANIMLNRAGRVKVADFGLAKRFGDGVDPLSMALTMSNVAVGTPDFVAPEALDPEQVPDHRADLYAVGVMLYQLLTGKLPRGMFQMPSELRPELDSRLDGIVSRAMASNPEFRYPSARDLRMDLDNVLTQTLPRVDAGKDSEAVPAAVPVTLSVKRGGKVPSMPPKGSAPASKPPKSGDASAPKDQPKKDTNVGLMIGLCVAVSIAIGLGVFWVFGPKQETDAKPLGSPASPEGSAASANPPPLPVPRIPEKAPAPSEATIPIPPAAPKNDPPAVPVGTAPKLPEPPSPPHSTLVAKADPPTTMPDPTPAPAPAAPAPSPHTEIASFPGLKTRLNGYFAARNRQWRDLAGKYLGGLDARLNQAADAGDLKLATAFGEEKARIEVLLKALESPPTDPQAAVADQAPPLPALAEASPEALVALRQTWTTESDKIRATLDTALQQSLQSLEAELTKARDFEKAIGVLAFRESLQAPAAAPAPTVADATGAPASTPPGSMPPATAKAGADPILSRATKAEPFVNSLGMKFVPVPDTGILLCIHETKKGDYAKFAAENPGVQDNWKNPTEQGVPVGGGDDHPVVSVNWNDAKAFCDWLSQKENRTYRLPTDREWSEAAGIARDEEEGLTPEELHHKPIEQYSWGTKWPPPKGAGNYGDTALKEILPRQFIVEGYTDGFATTAPVMSFRADRLGLFDLGGNVMEWCEDWFNADHSWKVMRGSAWDTRHGPAFFLSNRGNVGPPYGFPNIGFRCALVISPDNALPDTTPPSAAKTAVPDPVPGTATKTEFFVNTLGMRFVPLPDTDVLFCIHETRMDDYAAYVAEAPGIESRWDSGKNSSPPVSTGVDHPVTHVNWSDAKAFCVWLSKKEGRTYRLPTDREWSVAAGISREESRIQSDGTPASLNTVLENCFPWKGGWPPPKGAGNFADESLAAADSKFRAIPAYTDGFPTTSPVMSFDPNSLGIHDLGGNVNEWCEDWFDPTQKTRTIRGSSWTDDYRKNLFLSFRSNGAPDVPNTRIRTYGFRIVLDTNAEAPAPQSE